eukprot:TRINITY_DN5985_c0_g1_i2.p1 TRINITY_DN5985_c0_g1~~TRINITY_DN5985_c0_g1_i2.p1  ORF type:complete len:3313 (-),score=496.77 TRINITY_DN5985_c0_g1_i2:31-8538(-)
MDQQQQQQQQRNEGMSSGGNDEDSLRRYHTRGWFDSSDFSCPPQLPVSCGFKKCAATTLECIAIRAYELSHSASYLTSQFDECKFKQGQQLMTTADCTSLYNPSTFSWLPDAVFQNVLCWCKSTAVPNDEVSKCVRRRVFDAFSNAPSDVKESLRNAKRTYNDAVKTINDIDDLLPSSEMEFYFIFFLEFFLSFTIIISSINFYSLFRKREAYQHALKLAKLIYDGAITLNMAQIAQGISDAYKDCCCSADPGFIAGFFSFTEKSENNANWCDFIGKQGDLYGRCEDKRGQVLKPKIKKDIMFLVLGDKDMIAKTDYDQKKKVPGTTDYHIFTRNNNHVDGYDDGATPSSSSEMVDQPFVSLDHTMRVARAAPGASLPGTIDICIKLPDPQIMRWDGKVVSIPISLIRLEYQIPVWAGIFVDIIIEGTLNLEAKLAFEFCVLSLKASATLTPHADLTITTKGLVDVFLVRAGLTLKIILMKTDLPITPSFYFNQWPTKVGVKMAIKMEPLSIDVCLEYSLRIVIKWCWVVPCGLDWNEPEEVCLGGWSAGSLEETIYETEDAQGSAPPVIDATQTYNAIEDVPITFTIIAQDPDSSSSSSSSSSSPSLIYRIDTGGQGSSSIADSSVGTLSYVSSLNTDGLDEVWAVATDADGSESPGTRLSIMVSPVADAPNLVVENTVGDEDTIVPIKIKSSSLNDLDGSERLELSLCNCYQPDYDSDTIADDCDNCPRHPNPEQIDINRDGVGDICCPVPALGHWHFNEEISFLVGDVRKPLDYSGYQNHATSFLDGAAYTATASTEGGQSLFMSSSLVGPRVEIADGASRSLESSPTDSYTISGWVNMFGPGLVGSGYWTAAIFDRHATLPTLTSRYIGYGLYVQISESRDSYNRYAANLVFLNDRCLFNPEKAGGCFSETSSPIFRVVMSTTTPRANEYYHVGVTFNTTHCRFFLNGVATTVWTKHGGVGMTRSGTPYAYLQNSVKTIIGAWDYYSFEPTKFGGIIDNVQVYGRVLNDTEMYTLYSTLRNVNTTLPCMKLADPTLPAISGLPIRTLYNTYPAVSYRPRTQQGLRSAEQYCGDKSSQLCGCGGLKLPEGSQLYVGTTPITKDEAAHLTPQQATQLGIKLGPEQWGFMCWTINAIACEQRNQAADPAQQEAVTSRPVAIQVMPLNDPPSITCDAFTFQKGSQMSLAAANFGVYDVDSLDGSVVVTVSAPDGVLSVNYNVPDHQVITSTPSYIQWRGPIYGAHAMLQQMYYTPNTPNPVITVTVSDVGNSGYVFVDRSVTKSCYGTEIPFTDRFDIFWDLILYTVNVNSYSMISATSLGVRSNDATLYTVGACVPSAADQATLALSTRTGITMVSESARCFSFRATSTNAANAMAILVFNPTASSLGTTDLCQSTGLLQLNVGTIYHTAYFIGLPSGYQSLSYPTVEGLYIGTPASVIVDEGTQTKLSLSLPAAKVHMMMNIKNPSGVSSTKSCGATFKNNNQESNIYARMTLSVGNGSLNLVPDVTPVSNYRYDASFNLYARRPTVWSFLAPVNRLSTVLVPASLSYVAPPPPSSPSSDGSFRDTMTFEIAPYSTYIAYAPRIVSMAITSQYKNRPPMIVCPGMFFPILGAPRKVEGIQVWDYDVGQNSMTSVLTYNDGLLTVSDTVNVSISRGVKRLTLVGPMERINVALNTLYFTPSTPTSVVQVPNNLTIVINDNGKTGVGGVKTKTVNIPIFTLLKATPPALAAPALRGVEGVPLTMTFNIVPTQARHSILLHIYIPSTSIKLNRGTYDGVKWVLYPFDFSPGRPVYISMPEHDYGTFNITYVAWAVEPLNGDMANTTSSTLITFDAQNDAPIIDRPPSIKCKEQVLCQVDTPYPLRISDVDIPSGYGGFYIVTLACQIYDACRVYAQNTGNNAVITNNGTAIVKISGALQDVNAALSTLTLLSDSNYVGYFAFLEISVNDTGTFGLGGPKVTSASIIIFVKNTNDPPTFTAVPPSLQGFPPGGQACNVSGLPTTCTTIASVLEDTLTYLPAFAVGDPDPNDYMQIEIRVLHGWLGLAPGVVPLLSFPFQTYKPIAEKGSTSFIVFEGKKNDINQALSAIRYLPGPDYNRNHNGSDFLSITVRDHLSFETRGFFIDVIPVNDAPVLSISASTKGNSNNNNGGSRGSSIVLPGESVIYSLMLFDDMWEVDHLNATAIINITADAGLLTFIDKEGATVRFQNDTGTFLQFSGTRQQLKESLTDDWMWMDLPAALRYLYLPYKGIKFTMPQNVTRNITLRFCVDDLGHTGLGGRKSNCSIIVTTPNSFMCGVQPSSSSSSSAADTRLCGTCCLPPSNRLTYNTGSAGVEIPVGPCTEYTNATDCKGAGGLWLGNTPCEDVDCNKVFASARSSSNLRAVCCIDNYDMDQTKLWILPCVELAADREGRNFEYCTQTLKGRWSVGYGLTCSSAQCRTGGPASCCDASQRLDYPKQNTNRIPCYNSTDTAVGKYECETSRGGRFVAGGRSYCMDFGSVRDPGCSCVEPLGACCDSEGGCIDGMWRYMCPTGTLGVTFHSGKKCGEAACPVTGACCIASEYFASTSNKYDCENGFTETACLEGHRYNTWLPNTTCSTVIDVCPAPVGSCCDRGRCSENVLKTQCSPPPYPGVDVRRLAWSPFSSCNGGEDDDQSSSSSSSSSIAFPTCPSFGACCYISKNRYNCSNIYDGEADCKSAQTNATWIAGAVCSTTNSSVPSAPDPGTCPADPLGVCCSNFATNETQRSSQCQAYGRTNITTCEQRHRGKWLGPNAKCEDCPVLGTCCLRGGSWCGVRTQQECGVLFYGTTPPHVSSPSNVMWIPQLNNTDGSCLLNKCV